MSKLMSFTLISPKKSTPQHQNHLIRLIQAQTLIPLQLQLQLRMEKPL